MKQTQALAHQKQPCNEMGGGGGGAPLPQVTFKDADILGLSSMSSIFFGWDCKAQMKKESFYFHESKKPFCFQKYARFCFERQFSLLETTSAKIVCFSRQDNF
jgi:hypothetical protein